MKEQMEFLRREVNCHDQFGKKATARIESTQEQKEYCFPKMD